MMIFRLCMAVATYASTFAMVGCDTSDSTQAIVVDAFPDPNSALPAAGTAVFKVWWSVTLFSDPVAAGGSSEANRVVPGTDYAYALLAPGWDPGASTPPTTLIPVRSSVKVGAARGDTLGIVLGASTVTGDCATGAALSQDEADFITSRIFPGDFEGVTYDAARCTTTPEEGDAGSLDAGSADGESAADAGPQE